MGKVRDLAMEEQALVENFLKENYPDLSIIPGSAVDRESVRISCTDGCLYNGKVADAEAQEYLIEICGGKVFEVGRLNEEKKNQIEAERLMKSYGLNPEEWFFLWNVENGIEIINIAGGYGKDRRVINRNNTPEKEPVSPRALEEHLRIAECECKMEKEKNLFYRKVWISTLNI